MYKVQMRHGTFLKDLFETNPMQPELAFYLVGKVRLLGVQCDPKLGSLGAQRGHDAGRGVGLIARVVAHIHTQMFVLIQLGTTQDRCRENRYQE